MTRGRCHRLVVAASIAALGLAMVACDLEATAPAPTPTCTETGAQCQLPDGPLGVCERSACGPGEAAPCFRCTPQH